MSPTRLLPGDPAPDFYLEDQDGERVSGAAMRRPSALVYFYPADMTPGCTTEAREFQEALGALEAAGVGLVGISPDDAASHRRFRAQLGLTFPLLCDPDHAVAQAYGAYGERVLYGRSVVGVIRSSILIGPDSKVVHAWYNVRAHGHATRVVAWLGASRPGAAQLAGAPRRSPISHEASPETAATESTDGQGPIRLASGCEAPKPPR